MADQDTELHPELRAKLDDFDVVVHGGRSDVITCTADGSAFADMADEGITTLQFGGYIRRSEGECRRMNSSSKSSRQAPAGLRRILKTRQDTNERPLSGPAWYINATLHSLS